MKLPRMSQFCMIIAALAVVPSPSSPAPAEIVIGRAGVEPPVFHTTTGQRVEFVKRVESPAHVEFGDDPVQHHVYQLPARGPIWAIFHRPGTHPYAVHIYGDKSTTTLHGIVEVSEDPQRPWDRGTCGALVMEDCIEP